MVVLQNPRSDSCRADFERVPLTTSNNLLTAYYKALPWHNNHKKPSLICWTFGDGKDTCIKYMNIYNGRYAVAHHYHEPGLYEVCVKILYYGGCEAKKCKLVQIGRPDSCKADFETLTATSTNNPLQVYFKALPWHNNNKKPVTICWLFGDGRDTCIKYEQTYTGLYAVGHRYNEPGTYEVCVKILYFGGCESRKCKSIIVARPDSCRADFEKIPTTSNTTLTSYFRALAWNNNNKKPARICWTFGDGRDTCIKYETSYTGQYVVSHHYQQHGAYEVCVSILYFGGCEAKKCKPIQTGEPDSCRADFETISVASNSLRKYFIASPWHNHNKKPVYICWKFGDNHDTCIKYTTAYTGTYVIGHTYNNAGQYEVCVRIVYDGGCEAKKCKVVPIGERDSCSADFETISVTSNPLRKYFIANPWHNHNKKPIYICWNFGDNHDTCIQYSNTNSSPYTVDHTYTMPGQYEVCIRIVYDGGCVSEKCNSLQIGKLDSCYADFEKIPSTSVNNPSFVYYRALPKNNHEKKPVRICWSFGDGKDTCISYAEDYSGTYITGHHYEHSGMYEVCVKIIYRGGCEARKCKIINISIYSTDTCRVHLYEIASSVTSLTKAFYFASATNNRLVRVCWNFGDGTDTCITAEPNATGIPHIIKHAYPAPGNYRVCVKVMFLNGCTASDCIEVSIRSFTDICGGYYTDSLIDSRTYIFKAFSIHKPDDAVVGYRWGFGDGSSAIGEKVDHTYHEPGVYRVCLLINTEKGCETKICNNVRVAGSTRSRLQLSPNPVINILHVLFYSTRNENVKIKIINSTGVVVKEYSQLAVAGLNTWEFDVAGLLTGIYSFVVQSPNQFASDIFFRQ